MSTTREFPAEDFIREAEKPFAAAEMLFHFDQLSTFYCVPGEFGHFLEGGPYGFAALSIIVTETYPGGGPFLHTHECEEAHILLEGTSDYVLGDQRFTAIAPYVLRIPAGVPHCFVNAGSQPYRMICAFPDSRFTEENMGPNPLLEA